MKNSLFIFFMGSLISLLVTGCFDEPYEKKRSDRAKLSNLAKNSQEPIVIGIAWTENRSAFLKGIKLAVDKINSEGGVLNRPLKIVINKGETKLSDPSLSDREYQNIVINIAESFANNPNIIAVIGHGDSKSALLASVIYQNNGLLFFAPTATNLRLTNHSFEYVFRTIPNNYEMGIQIADYIAEQGYKKVALLYDRSTYAIELASTFSGYASKKHGTQIVFSRSFFKSSVNLTSLIIDLKKTAEFDLIFIASTPNFVSRVYQKSRDMGIRTPFVGGETLATRKFLVKILEWENADNIKKTMIPTIFNPLLAKNQAFMKLFKATYPDYNHWPEQIAALGYDNIMLLSHAIKRAQSTTPMRIADSLRYMDPCQGVAGNYQFSETGELISKPFYFRKLQQGLYHFQQSTHVKEIINNTIETCNQIDRDKDSIPNDLDSCPDNTAEEITKGIITTGLTRGCPLDTDKDGVGDYQDSCPKNTLKEISKGVNKQGCPLDTDGDKFPDYKDPCPNNPELTKFISGKNCVEDRDGDNITDDIDQCPDNTKEEIVKGVNKEGKQRGCPVDIDIDTVMDYQDSCPKNTLKEISQGVDKTGCPADNDSDGILDYLDQCLQTPVNAEIDEQGCGIIKQTILLQDSDRYFNRGKIILTIKGKAYLEAFFGEVKLKMLKQIKITVHTDNLRNSDKNQTLSDDRAKTLANYLIQRGIDAEKIISEGKGDSIPITNNKTRRKRKQNRRLEFILMQFKDKIPIAIPTE